MAVDPSFLQARPQRRLNWEEDDEGRAILLRPKLGGGRWGRGIASHFRNPCYRIRLDEVGTLVWKSCDGSTRLFVVVQRMRECFGPQAEPAEQRLYEFIQRLYRARLIEF